MSDIVNPILQWLNAHPHLAGIGTFIISAAESVAIIGTIIPGSVMMTAIGTLAGAGVIPLWSTIIWAILGAIAGDSISYWLGRYFKDRLHSIWPFRKYPHILEKGEKFFHKHGGKSVFIGRFVGPVRALVPLVAGMLGMKPWRFAIANVTSAIGWAPAYMLPGIALGAASLELPPDIAVHAILVILLIILVVFLCLWLAQKLFLLIRVQTNQILTSYWQRVSRSKHFSLITTVLKHHDPAKSYGQLTLAFYFLLTSVLFIYLAFTIQLRGSDNIIINDIFFHLFRSFRTPIGDSIFLHLTLLGEFSVLLPVALVIFFWLARKRYWHTAWHVIALVIFTALAVKFFKFIVHSPRPWGIVQSPAGGSFPSGHSAYTLALFLGFTLLLIKNIREKIFASLSYSLASVLIAAVCLSRLYLGAHWLTDVIGGLLLASAILMVVVLSYNRKPEKTFSPAQLLNVFLLTLVLSYIANYYFLMPKLKQNSAQIPWPMKTVNLNSWWEQTGSHLPLNRINRFGLSTQKLNLQWLENIEVIKALLLQNGWQNPPPFNWITILHRLSDVQSAEHLPLVSPLYLDQKPVLVLIKAPNGNKKLIVLRLWDSRIQIKNNSSPLWVGTVESVPRTYSWLFRHNRTNDINLNSNLLFNTVPKEYDIKLVKYKNTAKKGEQTIVLIKRKGM